MYAGFKKYIVSDAMEYYRASMTISITFINKTLSFNAHYWIFKERMISKASFWIVNVSLY